jgi:hypothetical protein
MNHPWQYPPSWHRSAIATSTMFKYDFLDQPTRSQSVRERDRIAVPEALPEADPAVIEEIARLDQRAARTL